MRKPRFLSAAIIIAFLVMVATMLNRKAEEHVVGAARAIDGDSLVISGREMRIRGIDAPEARQICRVANRDIACGRESHRALQDWLKRGPASCIGSELDRYGRLLVLCRVNGTDIGADLVRMGHAVEYGEYHAEEREARAAYRGLWAGEFERPSEYRRRQREAAEAGKSGT
jgi:endonuclease YncB( thermonuclease family)